jgi:hypothetical protein
MGTNGSAVDALQRELLKAGRRKKAAQKSNVPSKRTLANFEKSLKK